MRRHSEPFAITQPSEEFIVQPAKVSHLLANRQPVAKLEKFVYNVYYRVLKRVTGPHCSWAEVLWRFISMFSTALPNINVISRTLNLQYVELVSGRTFPS